MIYFKPPGDIIALASLFTSWKARRNPTSIFSSLFSFSRSLGTVHKTASECQYMLSQLRFPTLSTSPLTASGSISFPWKGEGKQNETVINTAQVSRKAGNFRRRTQEHSERRWSFPRRLIFRVLIFGAGGGLSRLKGSVSISGHNQGRDEKMRYPNRLNFREKERGSCLCPYSENSHA